MMQSIRYSDHSRGAANFEKAALSGGEKWCRITFAVVRSSSLALGVIARSLATHFGQIRTQKLRCSARVLQSTH